MQRQTGAIRPIYSMKTRVNTCAVGPDRLLTPTAQLQLQQEAGELHFGEGGCGFAEMAAVGLAFVTVQNNCVIYRRPTANEEITVQTWSRGVRGVRFFRGYRFLSEKGERLIESTASFALVDAHTHSLLRPSALEVLTSMPETPCEEIACPDPPRIKLPDRLLPVGTHTVRTSQLDFNGHLNNTRYADLLCDYAPIPLCERRLSGFSILYRHEARAGDTLSLFASVEREADGEQVYLHGEIGDTACFSARLLLR